MSKRLKLARHVNEMFNTEAGKYVWKELRYFYHMNFHDDMTPQQMAFKAGQRDVVQWLWDLMSLAKSQGQQSENFIEVD